MLFPAKIKSAILSNRSLAPLTLMPFSFTSDQKQTCLWLTFAVLLVALLVLLGPVLTPFIAAAILGYALNPGVDWLAAQRLGKVAFPRALAVMTVMLLVLAAILALVL